MWVAVVGAVGGLGAGSADSCGRLDALGGDAGMLLGGGAVIEMDPGAMRAAADAARSAGEQMRGVDLAASAGRVGAAVPGSRSAQAAGGLAASWARGTQGWAQAAIARGDTLDANAGDAVGNDTSGAGRIASALEPGGR